MTKTAADLALRRLRKGRNLSDDPGCLPLRAHLLPLPLFLWCAQAEVMAREMQAQATTTEERVAFVQVRSPSCASIGCTSLLLLWGQGGRDPGSAPVCAEHHRLWLILHPRTTPWRRA